MLTQRTTWLATAVAMLVVTTAFAQTEYNRSVEAISITPAPTAGGGGGFFNNINAYIKVEAGNTSAPLDLSTMVEFRINGSTIDAREIGFDALPNSDPGCGGCQTNQACICCEVSPGNIICICGGFIAQAPSAGAMQPGDEIMVILYPAPGALPDTDQSDDQLVIQWPGDPLVWNRRIESVSVTPSSGQPAGSFFDVTVDVVLEGNYDGQLNLATAVDLLDANGTVLASANISDSLDDLIWTPCNATCTLTSCILDPAGPYFGTCQPDAINYGCGCQYQPVPDTSPPTFEAIPLEPGTPITVLLRPVPGALPELPGFPDDDEMEVPVPEPCLGDTDGNGLVDVTDLLSVIQDWGTDGSENGGDVNDDGIVNVEDLVLVINNWGNCFPV